MSIVNNNEVKWPVNPQEVYALLGIAPDSSRGYDIGTLCDNRHGKINPASKVKPIRYAGPGWLTFAQFKGTMNDHADGIYYGLRCALHQGQGDGKPDGTRGWAGLHKCDWSYLPPVLGQHFFRLTDFALSPNEAGTSGRFGYKHNARFNPVGYVAGITGAGGVAILHYDQPGNVDCSVSCQVDSNTNQLITTLGVNLQDVAGVTDIGDWYPCILVSGLSDAGAIVGPHFARALAETGRTETTKYQKLRNTSDAWDGRYVAEMYSEEGRGDVIIEASGFPWPSAPCKMIATLFIVKDIGGAAAINNFRKWSNVGDMAMTQAAYTVPGGAGIILDFQRAYAQGLTFKSARAYLGIGANANGKIVVMIVPDWVKEGPGNMPQRDATYTFSVNLTTSYTDSDGITQVTPAGAGRFVIQGIYAYPDELPDGSQLRIMQVDIVTDLMGMGFVPGGSNPSTTFGIYWSVTSDKTGNRILNSGNSSVTYTYN